MIPSPSPSLRPGLTVDDVSPGFVGFVWIFFLALACIAIFLLLTRQLRRMNREYDSRVAAGDLEPDPERADPRVGVTGAAPGGRADGRGETGAPPDDPAR